ncbi:TetR/AcrR family transcriptional regulator [Caldicellulosiruptoraceae bacterium PP1]
MPKPTFYNLPDFKKNIITDTLIKYFSLLPYIKVDIADIAKECKIAKGSMYQYFKNKKDMYFYAVDQAFQHSLSIIERFKNTNISFFDMIELSLSYLWDFIKEYPYSYTLLERAFYHIDSPFLDEIFNLYLNESRIILSNIIKQNQENGYIRNDISSNSILLFIEGVSIRFKQNFIEIFTKNGKKINEISHEEVEKWQKEIILLLKEGLKA